MTRTQSIRWTAARKRELVASILSGDRTKASALETHPDLSEEELDGWVAAYRSGKGNANAMSQKAMHEARKPVTA